MFISKNVIYLAFLILSYHHIYCDKSLRTKSLLRTKSNVIGSLYSNGTGQLYAEESLSSTDGAFKLSMQGDGNLVIYTCKGRALWSSNTYGNNWLNMQGDGNLVIYNISTGKPVWSSNTVNTGTAPYQLKMQTDGNLVIYDANGSAKWGSNTNNITYECSTIQICFSLATNSAAGAYTYISVDYNRPNDGFYMCSTISYSDWNLKPGQTYCCNAKHSGSADSSNGYLNFSNARDDGILIEYISTSDGVSISRFYPGTSSAMSQFASYMAGTCYNQLWIDQSGNGSCDEAKIKLNSPFESSNGRCYKVDCITYPW